MNKQYKIGIAVAVLLFVAMVISNSVIVVDEGEKGVVTTFGEVSSTFEPGLHFVVPGVQRVHKYSVRVQKTMFGDGRNNVLSAYSYDQQIIESYRISVTWQYNGSKIEDVYKHFGVNDTIFYTVVSPLIQQTSKILFGHYTSQTIVQKRSDLSHELDTNIKAQLKDYPIVVLSVQIEDVNFSRSYENIIEQTAQKKQEVEKAKNELQKVEIESQQLVARAESANKAKKLEADARAYAIKVQAEAEANAIKLKAEALKANKELVALTIAEKWNGSVPQTVMGDASGVVPIFSINDSILQKNAAPSAQTQNLQEQ
jgi:regulator of protease activity HflC (stomatin/prohibitin superfamily)